MNGKSWQREVLAVLIGLLLASFLVAEGLDSAGGGPAGWLTLRRAAASRDAFTWIFGLESYASLAIFVLLLVAIERRVVPMLIWALLFGIFHHFAAVAYVLSRLARQDHEGVGRLFPSLVACFPPPPPDTPADSHPGS